MAAVRHLGFLKFKYLLVCWLRDPCCITVPNFVKIGQSVAEISRFCDFHDGSCQHLGFSYVLGFVGAYFADCVSINYRSKSSCVC